MHLTRIVFSPVSIILLTQFSRANAIRLIKPTLHSNRIAICFDEIFSTSANSFRFFQTQQFYTQSIVRMQLAYCLEFVRFNGNGKSALWCVSAFFLQLIHITNVFDVPCFWPIAMLENKWNSNHTSFVREERCEFTSILFCVIQGT